MMLDSKILILLICFTTVYGYFFDYTENTELIQQRSGYDVKLYCNLKGLIDERKMFDVKIQWYFKQCDENCYQAEFNDWTSLPCGQSFCKSELWLRNITEKYSGLYKCTVCPYKSDAKHSLDIQLVRTYQLDVKNNSLAVPEFLDASPANKQSTVASKVVFQCRVHSEEHPTIKWFRRIQENSLGASFTPQGIVNFSSNIVRYNNHTYELLKTAPEKLVNDEIYLSKLILNNVQLIDEGFYACVAISFQGHKIREAYLQVLPNEDFEYWTDYDAGDELDDAVSNQTDPKEFWFLFLIPLGLAMLPLTVWLCYVCFKRFTNSASMDPCHHIEHQYSEEKLVTEHCVLNGK